MALPDKESPHIFLAVATDAELHEQQLANSSEWRGALSLEAYMRREKYLYSQELTKEGGMIAWMLVHQPPNGVRRVLCGCETLKKRALIGRHGKLEEVMCQGIASVFCPQQNRGKGYAGRMMTEIGKKLEQWQDEDGQKALFSVLFSDIGKDFYAAKGWQVFASTHVALPASLNATPGHIRLLLGEDLAELCAIDEQLIRRRLSRSQTSKASAVAVIPDHRQIAWHHAREEFVGKELYGKKPIVKGALVGDKPGSRAWCYWTHVWPDPKGDEPSTLHILRLVVEDDSFSDFAAASEDQATELRNTEPTKAVASLFAAAQSDAAQWDMKEIMLWNPSSTSLAAAQLLVPNTKVVHRETESLTSLRWFGEGSWQDVDWICNEKFGWC